MLCPAACKTCSQFALAQIFAVVQVAAAPLSSCPSAACITVPQSVQVWAVVQVAVAPGVWVQSSLPLSQAVIANASPTIATMATMSHKFLLFFIEKPP
jgi:hypothetical protein